MTKMIRLANDFSRSPSGRYLSDGPNSGERFREEFLYPAIMNDKVEVVLDGVLTLGSSFLDEAFGGLVREKGVTAADLRNKLEIKSTGLDAYVVKIWAYIEDPKNRKS
jgi:hypothetical protein